MRFCAVLLCVRDGIIYFLNGTRVQISHFYNASVRFYSQPSMLSLSLEFVLGLQDSNAGPNFEQQILLLNANLGTRAMKPRRTRTLVEHHVIEVVDWIGCKATRGIFRN